MDFLNLADFAMKTAGVVFVDHFSVCLSCVAVGVSVVALWREISGAKPRISVRFELRDARMLPRHHFIYGALLVANIGRCPFSIRRAGILLVNGVFAPNVNCPHSFPLTLRPGDSIEIPVDTNAGWLVSHPLVPAVEMGDGKLVTFPPFFDGFDQFVETSATQRDRILARRRIFPRRLRREFVKNARRKREQRKQ